MSTTLILGGCLLVTAVIVWLVLTTNNADRFNSPDGKEKP